MKIVLYILGYLALLLPSLMLAVNKYVDLADPAVVTPSNEHPFWLSGFGQCVWFGIAFLLPALVLLGFRYAMRSLWRGAEKDSHAVA